MTKKKSPRQTLPTGEQATGTLQIGAMVRAPGFRSPLLVVQGPNKKDEFLLAHGSFQVWVAKNQLVITEDKKKKKNSSTRQSFVPEVMELSIDLHGYRVLEAVAALERLLDEALLKNATRIRIVHGIGTGKLKAEIQAFLSKTKHVKRHAIDQANPGITWAYL